MKTILAVILVLIGSVYSATIPLKPSDISVESLAGNTVPLVRKARQFDQFGCGGYGTGLSEGYGEQGYDGRSDSNPYNNTPDNDDDEDVSNLFGLRK